MVHNKLQACQLTETKVQKKNLGNVKLVWKVTCTVKPVHNGHLWDPEKVAVVQRVAAVQGLVQNSG
jgi:hypothetical protein